MWFHYFEKYAGYLIPKDWCVVASLTSVHLDGINYENPFEFDPWRWEVSNLYSFFKIRPQFKNMTLLKIKVIIYF